MSQEEQIKTLTEQNKELTSLVMWCGRRLHPLFREYVHKDLYKVIGDDHVYSDFVKGLIEEDKR